MSKGIDPGLNLMPKYSLFSGSKIPFSKNSGLRLEIEFLLIFFIGICVVSGETDNFIL